MEHSSYYTVEQLMQKVYIGTGRVAHVIDTRAPRLPGETLARKRALCHVSPMWPGFWLGQITSQEDAVTVETLPMCRTCESLMGAVNAQPA